jgi:signal transduction histidine kinase
LPTLQVLQGPDKGRSYQAFDEPTLIGRSSDQVALSDNSASRFHAEIRPFNNSWVLVDLDSANGTFLNGQQISSPAPLNDGDQIKVGSTLLVFIGQDESGRLTGKQNIKEMVDLDLGGTVAGSSILSAVDGSEASAILTTADTADAVAAWNVLYKVAELVGTVGPVEAFLERVADIMFEHLPIDHLVLLMDGRVGESLTPEVVRYRATPGGGRPKIITSQTIISHVVETSEGVLCANAMADDRFLSDDMQDSIHQLGLRSVICVPVVAHQEVQGVFHLDCSMSRHTYTQEQLRLVVAIGRLAGMAIENARLQETRMQTARLAATGETVAFLSHHIRNILQGMQGGADVVELGLKKRNLEATESGWNMVRRNLDRIFHLTVNMLTFSKDRKPRIESGQLNKIVEDVIVLSQKRADEKGVMLLADLEEIPAVPLDPEGMHQVAHNVVLNAIEAAPNEGGRVNIRTTYDAEMGRLTLSISDNGTGISEEQRGTIFDAFHSTKGHGGTGLGLAAAKKIVEELGGKIDVQSVIGEGSTFHVTLPAGHPRLVDSDKTHAPGA